MKKILLMMFGVLSVFLLSSCNTAVNPLDNNDTVKLFPIRQNNKIGYINRKGEVVIQPQFSNPPEAFGLFYEGLAVACIENRKCGYIDETGKFAINPQFEYASRFSEGLAMVIVGEKLGYIDKTGKFVINPQFEPKKVGYYGTFSEGLAVVKVQDKYGFIDKTGGIIINPQFERAFPFTEGLAVVVVGGKGGFIDKEGKIIINPQFDDAGPFINELAAIRIGKPYGYVDKTGKIVINPQFDSALPFSDEGLAMIRTGDKVGFIDKEGKYVINPQFALDSYLGRGWDNMGLLYFPYKEFGKLSFSEGLSPVKIGNSFGYINKTGRITINPQFEVAHPFQGELAMVLFDSTSGGGMGWIDKEGKTVWRGGKEIHEPQNTNATVPSDNRMMGVNIMNTNTMTRTEMSTNTNRSMEIDTMSANTMRNAPAMSSNNSAPSGKTGRLTTDANIRSEANKDAASLGIHFRGARVRILDETSFETDGKVSTWYKIRVTEYGCSRDANLGCGKNTPNDADEGWVNAKSVLPD